MFKFLFAALFITAIFVSVVSVAGEEKKEEAIPMPDVVELTDDTFDQVLGTQDCALVIGAASWCGHCVKAKPLFQEAAAELKKAGSNIMLAHVDGEKNGKSFQRLRGSGYPTIALMRFGDFMEDFDGSRDKDGFLNFARDKCKIPVFSEITTVKEWKAQTKLGNMQDGQIKLAGVFASTDKVEYKFFRNAALSFAGTGVEVIWTATPAVLEAIGFYGSKAGITLYRPGIKPNKLAYRGTTYRAELTDWITANALPADKVTEYTPATAKLYERTGDSVVRIVYDGTVPAVAAALDAAVKAPANKGMRFATAKWDDFEKEAEKECGAEAKKNKLCVLATYGKKAKGGKAGVTYGLDNSGAPFSTASFDKFLDKFVNQKLKAKVKSAAAPEEEPTPGKVFELVGSNFLQNVVEGPADRMTLTKFYAPWCGHCKAMAPKWEELAAEYKDNDKILVSKFDMTANDLPPEVKGQIEVGGFPTIYGCKGGSCQKVEVDRTVEKWREWLTANA